MTVEYYVGRKPDPGKPHVVVSGEKTVSAVHCKISSVGDGSFKVEDLSSTNGTYVKEEGGWRRVSTVRVGADDSLRLGEYSTTVAKLLHNANEVRGRAKLSRNSETGAIERK